MKPFKLLVNVRQEPMLIREQRVVKDWVLHERCTLAVTLLPVIHVAVLVVVKKCDGWRNTTLGRPRDGRIVRECPTVVIVHRYARLRGNDNRGILIY